MVAVKLGGGRDDTHTLIMWGSLFQLLEHPCPPGAPTERSPEFSDSS